MRYFFIILLFLMSGCSTVQYNIPLSTISAKNLIFLSESIVNQLVIELPPAKTTLKIYGNNADFEKEFLSSLRKAGYSLDTNGIKVYSFLGNKNIQVKTDNVVKLDYYLSFFESYWILSIKMDNVNLSRRYDQDLMPLGGWTRGVI